MRAPAPAHTPSAATQRAARRDSWRALLRASFDAHGESAEHWAGPAGIAPQKAREIMSRQGGAELQVADVETLPLEVRRDVAEAIAATVGCTLAEVPSADDMAAFAGDVLQLANIVEHSSAVTAAYATAMADGSLSAAEAETIERAATAAMQALATLRRRTAQVRRERIVGVAILANRRAK